ncbi:MAG: hypothetical protein LBE35_04615 [Clostridiales bacterium]|nr:hypothetical protein [Clostridiales bacterium]
MNKLWGYFFDFEGVAPTMFPSFPRKRESPQKGIPREFANICREGVELLGQPEYALLEELLNENSPPNMDVDVHSIAINADFDAFPNIAEPAEWWRLGNLKKDGADAIIKAFRDETTPGAKANREIPIRDLARKYGVLRSKKLYRKEDLICRFMHEWGVEFQRKENGLSTQPQVCQCEKSICKSLNLCYNCSILS